VAGGYLTGARYEELADARVKDFDHRAKQLYIFGKTDGRNVLLQPDAQSLLERLTDGRQPNDFIFRREDGGKWSPSDQVRRMKAAIERAGLDPRGTFYALRHSYISEAIENNIPLTVIAENCGTSVRMIEVTYAKVLAQKKRQFIEQGAPSLHGSMS
jgi:integrase